MLAYYILCICTMSLYDISKFLVQLLLKYKMKHILHLPSHIRIIETMRK